MKNKEDKMIKIACAMISSKYVSDFISDGRAGTNKQLTKHEALAREANRYTEALEEYFK